ncbi:TPA: site-specific integrase [Escherichia coli]|nr:site-specific integrase [Escherichia coli]
MAEVYNHWRSAFLAYLLNSADVFIGGDIITTDESIEFRGGRNVGPLPTLYGYDGNYIEPVNQWLIHLKAEKRLENLSSYARALKFYWCFLESEELAWDNFPAVKALKPAYRYRNDGLLKKVKTGEIAFSTANTYICHLVQFYLWAAYEHYFPVTETNKPFDIEFFRFRNNDILAHMKPKFFVQTTDLRIRVPKDSNSLNIRRLSPLSQTMLTEFAIHLSQTSVEMQLICLLAAQCGLRIEEATGFTLTALNQAVQRTESRTHYEITIGPSNGVPTKYNKTRTIEITNTLLDKLQHYAISERRMTRFDKLQRRIKAMLKMGQQEIKTVPGTLFSDKIRSESLVSAIQNEPLFISQQGSPCTPQSTGARFGELRKKIINSGIAFDHKFHDLRCSYATYRLYSLLTAGIEPADALSLLMQWMGHKNESTTWKYLRYLKTKEALKEKISMLDEIMHRALLE